MGGDGVAWSSQSSSDRYPLSREVRGLRAENKRPTIVPLPGCDFSRLQGVPTFIVATALDGLLLYRGGLSSFAQSSRQDGLCIAAVAGYCCALLASCVLTDESMRPFVHVMYVWPHLYLASIITVERSLCRPYPRGVPTTGVYTYIQRRT